MELIIERTGSTDRPSHRAAFHRHDPASPRQILPLPRSVPCHLCIP
jgi:hypothetical protein